MEKKLSKTYGCIAVTGVAIDAMAQSLSSALQQNTHYHITLFTKSELQQLTDNIDISRLTKESIESLTNFGLGRVGNNSFVVLYWPQGNILRKQYGLPEKQFHITTSKANEHNIDKSVSSVVEPASLTAQQIEFVIQTCLSSSTKQTERTSAVKVVRFLCIHHVSSMTDKAFDGAWRILSKFGHADEASELAFQYLSTHPESATAHIRCAESQTLEEQAKNAMLHYAQAVHLALQDSASPSSIITLGIKGIIRASQHTEFGCVLRDAEATTWKDITHLFQTLGQVFSNSSLRKMVQDEYAKELSTADIDTLLSVSPSVDFDTGTFLPVENKLVKLPRFFRWLLPFRLAVMSQPKCRQDIQGLISLGITLIVTLTDERTLPEEWFADAPCRNLYIPVRDHRAPTNQQVDTLIKAMDALPAEEAAMVHCAGGIGRAGTFAACYLMARGFQSALIECPEPPYVFPTDAIRLLRHMRPRSIETVEQENFIKQYAKHLAGAVANTQAAAAIFEPKSPLEMVGDLSTRPSLIVCCGIPGSGKSTFSAQLAKHLDYLVISQDELGSKSACLTAMANALEAGRRMLVDRCNPYIEDRAEWLAHAFHPNDALCVWFDIDRELCIARADGRTDHPTIAQGRARKIILSFSKTLIPPSMKEKFACIARVPSNAASKDLLLNLGIPEHDLGNLSTQDVRHISASKVIQTKTIPERRFIYKFPRTRHLFNLGSATRDDLILTPSDATAFLSTSSSTTLTLEEKVDGANLGISICSTAPHDFRIQNRSHYVTSSSHSQFKKLDKWVADHEEGLRSVLEGKDGSIMPGRYVLYGEWMFAKHSIHYVRLPDMFLAFDLFDTETQKFLSRKELSKRLYGTNVFQVPEIPAPELLDMRSLLNVVKTRESMFYDGVLEGVYVRREQNGVIVDRAKIVRADFIAGNEHWSCGVVVPNKVICNR